MAAPFPTDRQSIGSGISALGADRQLWEDLQPADQKTHPWIFHPEIQAATISDVVLPLDHKILLELAIFDVHYQFWECAQYEPGYGTRNLHYHRRLRNVIEVELLTSDGKSMTMVPWLWRTWCLCSHDARGCQEYERIAREGGMKPYAEEIQLEGQHSTLRSF